VNGYPPIPPEAMDESGNPLKKKEERIKKKSLKKTTLTQMVGEVNLK